MSESDESSGRAKESSRRLAAIVFADVAGYTELSSRDEDLALRVIGAFQRLARRVMGDHGGRVVKFLGDGMLAEFQSLDSAVGASHALQAAFGIMDETVEAEVALRVGIHLGDVVFSDDGDVYGSGVNVASRIEGHAPPSGIVVSDSAYRHLRNRKAYSFSSIGEHELKGVPDPMELYVVLLEEQQPSAPAVKVIQTPEPQLEHPGWSFARWAFGVVLTLALAAYAADVPGVRTATVKAASALGFGSALSRTEVSPPTYRAVEGGAVVDSPVTLRFTSPIDPATATSSSIQLYSPDDTAVPISVSVQGDGSAVEITPVRPLRYETRYRIVITALLRSATGTAVELPDGDAPVEERLAFTTQPLPEGAPRLVESSPGDGTTDFGREATLSFDFDQALDESSVTEETVRLVDGDDRPVPATLACCGESGVRVTLEPTEPLGTGEYRVRLGGGLADVDGEYFLDRDLAFSVTAEAPPPAPPPTGPGTLTIRVVPPELTEHTVVYLDGEQLGAAPISAQTVQESIRHRIEIFATSDFAQNRLSVYSDEVILEPGGRRTIDAQVTPFGTISLFAQPPGVVYIDDREIGETPLVSLVTANRTHNLEVRPTDANAATHRPYVTEFSVSALEDRGLGRIQLPER